MRLWKGLVRAYAFSQAGRAESREFRRSRVRDIDDSPLRRAKAAAQFDRINGAKKIMYFMCAELMWMFTSEGRITDGSQTKLSRPAVRVASG